MTPDPFSEDLTPEPFSADLLRRSLEGDQAAWEVLISRYRDTLRDWAKKKVPKMAPGGILASDVAQESAMKALSAFQRLSQLKGSSKGELESWLRKVVESSFLDMLRKAEAEKRDDAGILSLDSSEAENVPASQPTPSQVSAQRESWRELLMHFSELPDAQREALSLLHFQRLPMPEIAERLNRSENAVDLLLRRGGLTLRDRMEGSSAPQAEPVDTASRVRLDAALSVYFRRRETEASFDLEAFVADYPDCADELRGLLGWLEQLRELKPPTGE